MRKKGLMKRPGEIIFEEDPGDFWPFLVPGQYVHVGDDAVRRLKNPDARLIEFETAILI